MYATARTAWPDLTPEWAAGARLHTEGHTFALWAGSSYAMTPLDRLAPGQETDFAIGFSLARDFRFGLPPLMKAAPPPPADASPAPEADLLGDIPAMPGAPPPPPAPPAAPEPAPIETPAP